MRKIAETGLRSRRLLWRAMGLGAVMTCVAAGGASAAVSANQYGVVSTINGFSLWKSPQQQWGPQLAAMQANGIQMVRSDAVWSMWGPTTMDSWVAALAKRHLTWEPILDQNFDGGQALGSNTPTYAANAAALAARYGPNGRFWAQNPGLPYEPVQIFELWNEENLAWNLISAQSYGPLYIAVHNAIHNADPSASVIVGGLSDSGPTPYSPSADLPSKYLVQLFGYYPQLAQMIDGYGLHPYALDAWTASEWIWNFRHTLNQYGVPGSVPIDITEFGWQYSAGTETWRAYQMNAAGPAWARSNCGIREVAPYDWINPYNDTMNDPDWGFVDPSATNATLRAAGAAWFAGLAKGSTQSQWTFCS